MAGTVAHPSPLCLDVGDFLRTMGYLLSGLGLRDVATVYHDILSANGGDKDHLYRRLRFLRLEGRLRAVGESIAHHRRVWQARHLHTQGVIQRLHKEKTELENIIDHDVQTGLPSRRVFNRDIEEYLNKLIESKRMRHVAILFVGLDSTYNKIKQTLGYTVSDTLLYITASRMQKCLANLPYRLYQSDRRDEFIILLESTIGEVECVTIAEALHGEIFAPHHFKGNIVRFGCHIGISIFPEHGENKEELLRNADTAMAEAQSGSVRSVVYRPAMGEAVYRAMRMEHDLRLAIEGGGEQFRLLYQPLVDTRGRVRGMEALLRWEHPEHGRISPDAFIGMAEETGLIIPIGHWVLYRACDQLREWHDKGYRELYMSINLSVRQLEMPNIVDVITQAIGSRGLDPESVKIELTESVVMSDPEEALRIIETLHQRGIRILIDDFGTGYSSLNYLNRFPVDTLKIDQSFIHGMTDLRIGAPAGAPAGAASEPAPEMPTADEELPRGLRAAAQALLTETPDNAKEIVVTIIGMANNMRVEALAEGVETEAQRDYLVARGCSMMQGFFFSQPVEPDEFESIMDKGGVLPL